ncbi:MAG: hypothetical protein H6Q59_1333 [Firmicutes bacterium]|nr:hypothetical protein [Bacillota bacterium]
MGIIKKIIKTFFFVLAGSILSTAIFITIFWPGLTFPIAVIWQVIVMAAITSVGTLLFYSKREISKRQMRLRIILHYAYINFVVLATAFVCGWLDFTNLVQVVSMIILVAAVYFSVNLVMFQSEKRIADNINQRLRTKYPEDEKQE